MAPWNLGKSNWKYFWIWNQKKVSNSKKINSSHIFKFQNPCNLKVKQAKLQLYLDSTNNTNLLKRWECPQQPIHNKNHGDYSRVPIIRTVCRASSAVHCMYCQTGIRTSRYNRHFRVGVRFRKLDNELTFDTKSFQYLCTSNRAKLQWQILSQE